MRRLIKFLALSLSALPLYVMAIGLGNIEVKSGLNQAFDAEVPILDLHGINPHDVQVKLADPVQYDFAKVVYSGVLSQLTFKVIKNKYKRPVIAITSQVVIDDPVVDILLEVRAQHNVLVREYTVLLDPPEYLNGPSSFASKFVVAKAQPNPPVVVVVESGVIVEPAILPPPMPLPALPEPSSGSVQHFPVRAEPIYGPAQASETLWNIAKRVKPAKATPQQAMVAIYRANPGAFENQNMNHLKRGVTLTIPSVNATLAVSENEARNIVKQLTQVPASTKEPQTTTIQNDNAPEERIKETFAKELQQAVSEAKQIQQPVPTGNQKPELINLKMTSPADFEGMLISSLREDSTQEMNETQLPSIPTDPEKQALILQIQSLQKQYQWLQIRLQRIERMRQDVLYNPPLSHQNSPGIANPSTVSIKSVALKDETSSLTTLQKGHLYKTLSYIGLGLIFLLVLINLYRKRLERKKQFEPSAGLSPIKTVEDQDEILPMLEPTKAELKRPKEPAPEVIPIKETKAQETPPPKNDVEDRQHAVQNIMQEVSLFVAYGQYEKAIGLLNELLKQYPGEQEASDKLLEIQKAIREQSKEREKIVLAAESPQIEIPEIPASSEIRQTPETIEFSSTMDTEKPVEEFSQPAEEQLSESEQTIERHNVSATKLDLARVYIEMTDYAEAKDLLEQVILKGDEKQIADAQELLMQVENLLR